MKFSSFRSWCSRHRLLVAVLCAIVLAGAWFVLKPAKPEREFVTAAVARGDIEDAVLATGTLQPLNAVDVGAQVSGQLKSLKVELNDHVEKDQLLAVIDPTLLENDLVQAQASLESLQAQKAAKELQLKLAGLTLQRQKELLPQDAVSQQDLDTAQTNYDVARADLAAIVAQIKQAQANFDSAKANLQYTRIVAPIDGDVVSITTLEGQTVISAQQAPTILRLADLETMTVKAQVSEADVVRLKTGQEAYFTILGQPDKRYHGKLRRIEPTPEKISNAVYYKALFDVPNPERELRIDMTAQVSVVLAAAKNVLLIPAAALGRRHEDGRYDVRVADPKDPVAPPKTRTVSVGLNNNVKVEVREGLSEGEKVITGEASLSGDGMDEKDSDSDSDSDRPPPPPR